MYSLFRAAIDQRQKKKKIIKFTMNGNKKFVKGEVLLVTKGFVKNNLENKEVEYKCVCRRKILDN